jgi:membrane protease YdiL (CAAX protease family)
LDWTFGWIGPAAGVLAFVFWLSLDRVPGVHPASHIATGIASLGAPARFVWLALRTVAAVVTVSIAEELAFRGFLIRRVMSADFEALSSQSFSFASLAVRRLWHLAWRGGWPELVRG